MPKIDKFIKNDKNDLDSRDGIKFTELLSPKVEHQEGLHINSRGHADHTVHNHITHTDFINSHLNDTVVFLHSHTRHVAAQFRNIYPKTVKMWFGTGENTGVVQGYLRTGAETTLNGWAGHVFYFTVEENGKNCQLLVFLHTKNISGGDREVARFTLNEDQVLYVVRPGPEEMALVPPVLLEIDRKQQEFIKEYYNRTGIHWRHYFDINGPRKPPVLHMWPADHIGQIHNVVSREGYWFCDGKPYNCQDKDELPFELKVLSTHPKVFEISNFLNDYEAAAIINIAKPRVHRSTIGNGEDAGGAHEDSSRTSSNAWVSRQVIEISSKPLHEHYFCRNTNHVTETLYRRAADILHIDEKLLHSSKNAEEMQV